MEVDLQGPVIDLRGPCNTLIAKLAVQQGVVEYKCKRCSKLEGRPVFHYFDADTGLSLSSEELQEEAEG